MASRVFFFGGEGGPSKIDEQTNSYFAVGGRLSAFFHGLHDCLCNPIVVGL